MSRAAVAKRGIAKLSGIVLKSGHGLRATLAFPATQAACGAIGRGFFCALPFGPGVYCMCVATEHVLGLR